MADTRLIPALLAVFGGALLAVVLLLPFVIISYRRRGELGFGRTILAIGFLVYGLAIVTYTLLPLPRIDAAWCAQHPAFGHPQLSPLQFLNDIRRVQVTPGLRGLLRNPAVQQFVFNVVLFVPLGMFVRHVLRWNVVASVSAGLGVSLLVEFTQLTGNWFLFPCPYRLFDVDDLLANTVGAAVGVALAPVLRLVAGRHPVAPPGDPRPVTTGRRLQGMVLDYVSVYLLGGFVVAAVNAVALYGYRVDPPEWTHAALGAWLPAAALLVLPSLAKEGATVGQRAVRLRRVRAVDGGVPGWRALPACLAGGAGYFVLAGANLERWASLLLLVCLVMAWRPRSHRGLSGVVGGLLIVDARVKERSERFQDTHGSR